jgi:hypothetical protein
MYRDDYAGIGILPVYLHFDSVIGHLVVRMSICCMHYVLIATIANKRHYLSRSCIVFLDLKHTEASFSLNSIDLLCLRVTQVPRS